MPKFLSSSMFYLIAGAAIAALALFDYLSDKGDRNDRPPGHSRSYEPAQLPAPPRDERQKRHTIEPPSRRDYVPVAPVREEPESLRAKARRDDAPVAPIREDPASLRARAKREGELMTQCFQQSKEAYDRRDHAGAKALSAVGKRHEQAMKDLHEQASAAIYQEKNQGKRAGEIDLHGQYVKEAIALTEEAIREARQRGDSEIRLIVGKGNHSEDGPKLKPAVQEEMRARGLPVDVDPNNLGVLVVRVGSRW